MPDKIHENYVPLLLRPTADGRNFEFLCWENPKNEGLGISLLQKKIRRIPSNEYLNIQAILSSHETSAELRLAALNERTKTIQKIASEIYEKQMGISVPSENLLEIRVPKGKTGIKTRMLVAVVSRKVSENVMPKSQLSPHWETLETSEDGAEIFAEIAPKNSGIKEVSATLAARIIRQIARSKSEILRFDRLGETPFSIIDFKDLSGINHHQLLRFFQQTMAPIWEKGFFDPPEIKVENSANVPKNRKKNPPQSPAETKEQKSLYEFFLVRSIDYCEYRKDEIDKSLKMVLRGVKNPDELVKSVRELCSEPRSAEQIRRIMQALLAYLHLHQHQQYWEKLDEIAEDFQANLFKPFQKGKQTFFRFGGKEYKILHLGASGKAEFRMIDKLIRKPRENFDQIRDILRARVVLQNSEEVNYFVRSLRQQYKEIKIGKTGRFVSCKEKTSHDSNAARGDYEVRTIILSLDPFFNDKNSETSIQIPCEIQILHQKAYEQKENGLQHHWVYQRILQEIMLETRRADGASNQYVEAEVQKSARNPNIFELINQRSKRKNLAKIEIAELEIRKHIQKYAFKWENRWYDFGNVLRMLGGPLDGKWMILQDEAFRILNQKTGLKWDFYQWKNFFVHPENSEFEKLKPEKQKKLAQTFAGTNPIIKGISGEIKTFCAQRLEN